MKLRISKLLLIALLTAFAFNANAAKLYKWVDANGNISYQDQPPPKSGKILSEKELGSSDAKSKDSSRSNQNSALPNILVYSTADCELCERLVRVLQENKLPYTELPLESDRSAQRKILDQVDSVIAPTIFIGEKVVQVNTERRLIDQLRLAGFDVIDETNAEPSSNLKN